MKVTDNRPMPDKQPFHRDLDIEVVDERARLPDRRRRRADIVDRVAARGSVFVTLDFFDALGRTTTRRRLAAPGRIFPIMHPSREGKPGEVRIHYAGNASATARLEFSYREKGVEKPVRVTQAADEDRHDGAGGASRRSCDRMRCRDRAACEMTRRPRGVRAADALDNLARLHDAGLFKTALSYDHVDRVGREGRLKDARARRVLNLPACGAVATCGGRRGRRRRDRSSPGITSSAPTRASRSSASSRRTPKSRRTGPGTRIVAADISVMEITNPTASELRLPREADDVQADAVRYGRQHANEVSSTSHILRLVGAARHRSGVPCRF